MFARDMPRLSGRLIVGYVKSCAVGSSQLLLRRLLTYTNKVARLV